MRRLAVPFALAALAPFAIASAAASPGCLQQGDAAATIALFNGKDLAGWHADVPAADKGKVEPSFAVENGLLVSRGKPAGHLITDQAYGNYRLTVEWRWPGKGGNCGVLVHSSTPRVFVGMFPQSIECQMHSGNAGDFWCIGEDITVPDMVERRGPKEKWGILKGNRRIRNLTDGSEKPLGEWNTMVIECLGNEVRVMVNGELVNHGRGCTAGYGQIAIQAEGTRCEFRKVELEKLAPAAQIVPAGPGWKSLFDGKTLDGWTRLNGTATYRVENGAITGTTQQGSPNSFLCTDRTYSDFELRFEVKDDPRLNSGVQIRSHCKAKNNRVNGPQVEIEASGTKGGDAGYVYGEACGGWMMTAAQRPQHHLFRDDGWNSYRVLAIGPCFKVWVNGVMVTDIRDEKKLESHPSGFIGLQVHSIGKNQGPFEVSWRNLAIRDLSR